MNENINLYKILKNCKEGTKLYSPICGEVEFVRISSDFTHFPIVVCDKNESEYKFTKDGKYYNIDDGECLLFPSKENRDWSTFKIPKFDPKTFKPFDKVLVYQGSFWIPAIFTHFEINTSPYKMVYNNMLCGEVVPYTEETEYLVGTEFLAPEFYRYWED